MPKSDGQVFAEMGTDAQKWAEEFYRRSGGPSVVPSSMRVCRALAIATLWVLSESATFG